MNLSKIIYEGLKKEIDAIVVEEADRAAAKAQENVQKRVRDLVGGVSARVLEHFRFETRGNELVITVNFEGLDKKP